MLGTTRRSTVRWSLTAILLVAGALGAPSLIGAAPSSAAEVRVIARISGKFVSPPGTEPPGFDVEILRRFTAWTRVKSGGAPRLATSYASTIPALLDAIQRGKAELGVGGVTVTSERAKIVDFSLPILPNRSVLVAPPGVLAPETWRQHVKGLRMGSTVGSTNAAQVEHLASELPGIKVDNHFTTNEAVFDALQGSGRTLDAAVVDLPQYWTTGKAHGLVLVAEVGDPSSMAVVVAKGSAWKAPLDEFLKEFTHSSEYFQLIHRYFGQDAEKMVRMSKGSR
jgi:ABC-type amino acid transport substrate-binding protein